MATMNRDQQNVTSGEPQDGASVGSPISNDAYDVLAALHAKLEGLEAYRKYERDGNALFGKLSQMEQQSVGLLVDELERIVKSGKLRMQQPGKAH